MLQFVVVEVDIAHEVQDENDKEIEEYFTVPTLNDVINSVNGYAKVFS